MSVRRACERFKQKGLPNLAEHIDRSIIVSESKVIYTPPPGTLPWTVTHPSDIPPEIGE
jgi:hypothetical protein